jgi:DAK2 domain fusion protein YloV
MPVRPPVRPRADVRRACDGSALLAAFRSAVAELESHVDEINALNVYPVPDGDTGSNMLATVRAALEEAERVPEPTLERVAAALSFGALMGARGNSGVITSQIFRGMAEGVAGKKRFNGLDLAHAVESGNRTAYRAVARPVEGTILTVIREAADAAVGAAESANDVEAVLAASVAAADAAVAKTPSLLPILRAAGVVDAGGAGLARLFAGALRHLVGASPGSVARAEPGASALVAHADEGFGYETMFLLQPGIGASLDTDEVRLALEALGDSVVVAGDSRALKIHVHGERPDAVLAVGLARGSLSRISVENLDADARDLREGRASAFTGTGSVAQRAEGPSMPVAVSTASTSFADSAAPIAASDASRITVRMVPSTGFTTAR